MKVFKKLGLACCTESRTDSPDGWAVPENKKKSKLDESKLPSGILVPLESYITKRQKFAALAGEKKDLTKDDKQKKDSLKSLGRLSFLNTHYSNAQIPEDDVSETDGEYEEPIHPFQAQQTTSNDGLRRVRAFARLEVPATRGLNQQISELACTSQQLKQAPLSRRNSLVSPSPLNHAASLQSNDKKTPSPVPPSEGKGTQCTKSAGTKRQKETQAVPPKRGVKEIKKTNNIKVAESPFASGSESSLSSYNSKDDEFINQLLRETSPLNKSNSSEHNLNAHKRPVVGRLSGRTYTEKSKIFSVNCTKSSTNETRIQNIQLNSNSGGFAYASRESTFRSSSNKDNSLLFYAERQSETIDRTSGNKFAKFGKTAEMQLHRPVSQNKNESKDSLFTSEKLPVKEKTTWSVTCYTRNRTLLPIPPPSHLLYRGRNRAERPKGARRRVCTNDIDLQSSDEQLGILNVSDDVPDLAVSPPSTPLFPSVADKYLNGSHRRWSRPT